MKKHYTFNEKNDGELAARRLSEKAQGVYYGADPLAVYEYIDGEATLEAEEAALANDIDFYPGELRVIRYDVRGIFEASGLTFEELEAFFEDLADQLAECDD